MQDLDLFLSELLRKLPSAANPEDSKEAAERLFPKPSDSEETNQEWTEYVHPELRHLFESANATVAADIDGMYEVVGKERFGLRIPSAHLEAWLCTLNQARLVIAERNGFKEKDIDRGIVPVLRSQKDLQLFQLHFYGILQEVLLRG